jgi:NADH-quinone oxidoreductase subunit E
MEKKLGIKKGETTADGKFTLKGVECLAACGSAPMMQCGLHYHEHLTEESVDQLITEFKTEDKVRRPFPN